MQPLSDISGRFRGLKHAYLEQNGHFLPVELTFVREGKNAVYLFLSGVFTPDQAEGLRGAYLAVKKEDSPPLPEGSWYVKDLEGLEVWTEDRMMGKVASVLQTGGVDVYTVALTDGGTMMFPALKKVIERVALSEGKMFLREEELSQVAVYES